MTEKLKEVVLYAIIGVLATALVVIGIVAIILGNQSTTETFEIKIVHTNDMHARIEDSEDIIGIRRLAAIAGGYISGADVGMILDSGDIFHGQSIANLVQGESIAALIKSVGYDAAACGNHDWNYGTDRIKELEALSGLRILAGNVVKDNGEKFFDNEFLIKEAAAGNSTLKIGIMGMIDPKIYSSIAPFNVPGIKFTDLESYAADASARLRKDGCDIVIALGHICAPVELAKKINGVDLWLCGHDHIDISETVTTPDGTKSYVTENIQYLEQVGLINLSVDLDRSGNVTELRYTKDNITAEDISKAASAFDDVKESTEAKLNIPIGESPIELNAVKKIVRTEQTALGSIITESYRKATGAEIAFENSGGIRGDCIYPAGNITYGDVININSFGNYLVTKKVKGSDIRNIIELSLDYQIRTKTAYDSGEPDPEFDGSSLHFSGMTVEVDKSQEYGSRVISINVGNEAIVDSREYTVAISNYLATSNDYAAFREASVISEFCSCEEAIASFFGLSEEEILAAAKIPYSFK